MPDMHQPTSPDDDGVEDADTNGEPGVTDEEDAPDALKPPPGEPPEPPLEGD